MTNPEERPAPTRIRREPPRFRRVAVRRVEPRSARLVRITVTGAELDGLTVEEPAASVRLLLPREADGVLVVPTWNGNEFLMPDGSRPTIRTFTPRRVDPDARELDIEAVIHGEGPASRFAERAAAGAEVAISGPGRGYTIARDAPAFLLAGDESAIPAISQLLETLPAAAPVRVHIEVASPDARLTLADHPHAIVEWHDLPAGAPSGDAFVAAVRHAELPPGVRVWVAGEAAAVQKVRRYLFEEQMLPRAQASVRGYWKRGRAGDDET
jgi:NADPH-dependent ferric siderophore reductase